MSEIRFVTLASDFNNIKEIYSDDELNRFLEAVNQNCLTRIVLGCVINTWESATTDEKITLARIFLKFAFLLSFASCFLDELIAYPQKGEHKL